MNNGELKFIIGDATYPEESDDNKFIIHIANNRNAWGAGFVLAISKRWKTPEQEYRNSFKTGKNCKLGDIQIIPVENNIFVINMIAQRLYVKDGIPLDYDALDLCLDKVATEALKQKASIVAPRLGCGLAGSSWNIIEPFITEKFIDRGINVTIYDLAT